MNANVIEMQSFWHADALHLYEIDVLKLFVVSTGVFRSCEEALG